MTVTFHMREEPFNYREHPLDIGCSKVFEPKQVSETVARTLTDYKAWLGIQDGKYGGAVSDETVRRYTETARRLLVALDDLTAENVKRFMLAETEGKSAGTYNHFCDAIRKFAEYREERGLAHDFYTAKLFKRKKAGRQRRKVEGRRGGVYPPMNRDELEAVVAAARKRGDEPFAFYIEVAWDTLGRANEVLSLKVNDFDFASPEYGDAAVNFRETKTGEDQAGYIWSPSLAERIKDWFEVRGAKSNDWAFPGVLPTRKELRKYSDGRLKYHAAHRKFRIYCASAKLELPHSLHNIRAGSAVWMDAHDWKRTTIMYFGRWESLGALERYLREEASVVEADVQRGREAMLGRSAPQVTVVQPKENKDPLAQRFEAISKLAPEAQVIAMKMLAQEAR